jgi:hypothetical protein
MSCAPGRKAETCSIRGASVYSDGSIEPPSTGKELSFNGTKTLVGGGVGDTGTSVPLPLPLATLEASEPEPDELPEPESPPYEPEPLPIPEPESPPTPE